MSSHHLRYRGLPSEIRMEIWRLCLCKDVQVHGPYRKLIPEDPQVMHDHSDFETKVWQEGSRHAMKRGESDHDLFRLYDGPNVAILRLNKDVHQEVRGLMSHHSIFYDLRQLSKKAEMEFFQWLAPISADGKSVTRIDGRSISACGFAALVRPNELLDTYWSRVSYKPDILSIGSWLQDMARYQGIKRLLCELDIADETNGFGWDYEEHPFTMRGEETEEIRPDGFVVDRSVSYPLMIKVLQSRLETFWDISVAEFALQLFEGGSLETLEIIIGPIHHSMKMAVHDGGKNLLHFDKLRDERTLTERFRFEAVTYNQPDAVHIIIKIKK